MPEVVTDDDLLDGVDTVRVYDELDLPELADDIDLDEPEAADEPVDQPKSVEPQ